MRATRVHITLPLCFGFALSCGGGDAAAPGPAAVATVTLSAVSDSVQVNATLQITATLKDGTGATLTGRTVTFTSSDTTKARVASAGLVTGVAPSAAVTITTTSEGKSATMVVKVTDYWAVESGTRGSGNAPATLRLPDGSFIRYQPSFSSPGLASATSADGLAWSADQSMGLSETNEPLRNPAVVRLSTGTFIMIYEGIRDETLPTKNTRLYRATSTNGTTFAKTAGALANGAVLIPTAADNNFASAPDIIALANGNLRLYFNVGSGGLASATSTDNGLTWTRDGPVTVSGLASGRNPADGDVILLANGSFRLYFAAPPSGTGGNSRIFSAVGTDGRAFTLEYGERSGDASTYRVDPDVVLLANGKYRMYLSDATALSGPFTIKSALSP